MQCHIYKVERDIQQITISRYCQFGLFRKNVLHHKKRRTATTCDVTSTSSVYDGYHLYRNICEDDNLPNLINYHKYSRSIINQWY